MEGDKKYQVEVETEKENDLEMYSYAQVDAPSAKGGVWSAIKRQVTTKEGWIGDYDYAGLCMPRLPFLKTRRIKSPFYGPNDEISILLAIVMGLQRKRDLFIYMAELMFPHRFFFSFRFPCCCWWYHHTHDSHLRQRQQFVECRHRDTPVHDLGVAHCMQFCAQFFCVANGSFFIYLHFYAGLRHLQHDPDHPLPYPQDQILHWCWVCHAIIVSRAIELTLVYF